MDRLDLIKFARNFSYDISINRVRNYAYVSLIGLWDKTAHLEYYIEDIQQATKELTPGYTLIIDLVQYRGGSPDNFHHHIDALHHAKESSVGNILIIQPDNPMLQVAVEYIIKLSGMEVLYFSNLPYAERWMETHNI